MTKVQPLWDPWLVPSPRPESTAPAAFIQRRSFLKLPLGPGHGTRYDQVRPHRRVGGSSSLSYRAHKHLALNMATAQFPILSALKI